ncbi:MAG: SRPBCC family protein, partial [Bacteroidota bacterium]
NLESVVFIIAQDLIWVLASIVILWTKPFSISLLGNQIITLVALIVLIFGIGQSIGVSQTDSVGESGHKQLRFERTITASKEKVWKVVADVANYHQVAPNIDSVEILSGQGKGMVRRCSHKTDHWTEVATLWEEGEQYVFEVDTEAADYPYPLKQLQGTWKVEKVSQQQTRVVMIFEFTYTRKIHSLVLHPFMKTQFNSVCETLLDNWQTELESKVHKNSKP